MRDATIGRGGRRGRGAKRSTTRVEVRGRLTRFTLEAVGLRPEERVRVVRIVEAAVTLMLITRH